MQLGTTLKRDQYNQTTTFRINSIAPAAKDSMTPIYIVATFVPCKSPNLGYIIRGTFDFVKCVHRLFTIMGKRKPLRCR